MSTGAVWSSPGAGLGLSTSSETVLVTKEQYEFLLKKVGETAELLNCTKEQNSTLKKEIRDIKNGIADGAGNNDDNGRRIDRNEKKIKKHEDQGKKLTCGDICIKILMVIAGLILACLAIL